MYLRFDVRWRNQVEDVKRELEAWSARYGVRYTYKIIKYHFRVGFDNQEHFSLFMMTWNPQHTESRPWLIHTLIDIQNERY